MSSRRQFLTQAVAAGIATATFAPIARASRAAHPPGVRIKAAIRREETIWRFGGEGDNWNMSWAAGGKQYVSFCDGYGMSGQDKHVFNTGMIALGGDPRAVKVEELPSYPLLSYYSGQKFKDPRYYPFATFAVDGRIYQFLSTFNRGLYAEELGGRSAVPPPSQIPQLQFNGVKLVYSPDDGRTWRNQDGSSLTWEAWSRRSKETLLFFEEDQNAFAVMSVLQMGRNYGANRDGYVYAYAPNGSTDGTMNELVMFRVPKAKIPDRKSYEYFAGTLPGGNARWSADITARQPVHTFPRGWVQQYFHPMAWHPSVVYNAPLGIYMMVNWGMAPSPAGEWFTAPNYFGIWTAPQPWGPWTQIHEETAWMPGGESSARAYEPQIAPKWIAADGRSFWLVWTDLQKKGNMAEYAELSRPLNKKSFDDYTVEDWALNYRIRRRFKPYYSFNAQRVDLVL